MLTSQKAVELLPANVSFSQSVYIVETLSAVVQSKSPIDIINIRDNLVSFSKTVITGKLITGDPKD